MLNKKTFSWLNKYEIKLLKRVLTINNKITFKFVGGAVRDSIIGYHSKDFDIASSLPPEKNLQLLKQNNIKVIPLALKYGTILALINNYTFEITSLRKDIETYGRKATTKIINSYKEDALRRDFTFNALYLNPTTKVITDYFNGIDDLKAGKVRFIGNIVDRINEDYLRILRFIRFYTYFSKEKINNYYTIILKKNANNLLILSKERITSELNKIVNHPNRIKGIKLLNYLGISKILLKQKTLHFITLSKLFKLANYYNININNNLIWLSLLDNANKIFKFLSITKKDKKYIDNLLKLKEKLKVTHKASYFLARYPNEIIKEAIILFLIKIKPNNSYYPSLTNLISEINTKANFKSCVTGKDLLKLNISNGKTLGKILLKVKEWSIDNKITDKHLCLEQAKKFKINS